MLRTTFDNGADTAMKREDAGEVGDGLNHELLCLNLLDSGWFDDEVSVVRLYVGASRRIARKGSLCLQYSI